MTTAAEKLARLVLNNSFRQLSDADDLEWRKQLEAVAREVLGPALSAADAFYAQGPVAGPEVDYETADRLEAGVEYEVLPDNEPDAGQREDADGLFVSGHRFRANGSEMVWGQMPYAGRHYFALRVGTGLQRVRRVTPKAPELPGGPGPHAGDIEELRAEVTRLRRRLEAIEARLDRKVPRY